MSDVYVLEGKITLDTSEYEKALKLLRGESEQAGGEIQQEGRGIDQSNQQMTESAILAAKALEKMYSIGVEALKKMATTGIQYNAQIEKYTASLTTALGDEASAMQAIEKIKIDAAKTPYSVDGLVQANQFLISAGESAEDARSTILALTDAISATGGGNAELARMAQNLQQVKNAGKASSMDIRQFAMAGIDIYGLLADYTGKTTAEVKGLEVSYEMLTGALQAAASEGGKYFEANIRQSQTLNGQMSTLQDNVSQKLGDAFSGVSDVLSGKVLPLVNQWLEGMDTSDAQTAVLALGSTITALGIGIASTTGVLKKVSIAFSGLLTNPAFLAAAAVAGVVIAVKKMNDSFNDSVNSMVSTGETVEDVTADLEELKAKQEELQQELRDVPVEGYEMVRGQLHKVDLAVKRTEDRLAELEAAAEEAAAAAGNIPEGFEEALGTFQTDIQTLMTTYKDAFESSYKSASSWFGLFDTAKTEVTMSIDEMMSAMQSQIDFNNQYSSNLQYLAENGLAAFAESLAEMGDEGAGYAQAMREALENGSVSAEEVAAIQSSLEESRNGVATAMTNMNGEVRDQTQSVVDQFSQMVNDMDMGEEAKAAAENTMSEFLEGIKSGSSNVYDAMSAVASQMTSALQSSMGEVTIPVSVRYTNMQRFRTGLDYVPYDDYPALLHRGEQVLTATEAQARRSGEERPSPRTGSGVTIVQNIQTVPQTPVELAAASAAYFELARWE